IYERGTVTRVSLFDEDVVWGKGLRMGFAVATHDLQRKLALQRALDCSDDRRRVLVPPGRVLLVRLAVPLVDVVRSAILVELCVLVVDPMAGEGAGGGELVL